MNNLNPNHGVESSRGGSSGYCSPKNMLEVRYSSICRTLHGYTPLLASAKVRDNPCGQPNLDLGLTGAFERGSLDSIETVAALQAFRKRHADAQRIHGQLTSQPATVDFTYYRSILKNQNIANEAEKLLKDFKPVTYDANAHIKAIEAFEAKAVSRLLLIS
jgi:hypothetical protein